MNNALMIDRLQAVERARARIPLLEWQTEQKKKELEESRGFCDCIYPAGRKNQFRENPNDKRLIELEALNDKLERNRQLLQMYDDLLDHFPAEEKTMLGILAKDQKPGERIKLAMAELKCGRSQAYRVRDQALRRLRCTLNYDGLLESFLSEF